MTKRDISDDQLNESFKRVVVGWDSWKKKFFVEATLLDDSEDLPSISEYFLIPGNHEKLELPAIVLIVEDFTDRCNTAYDILVTEQTKQFLMQDLMESIGGTYA